MTWLAHILGLNPGYWNMFWSGFGSCLSEFAIVGGLITYYKRSTCHVNNPRFCWRPGLHPVAGSPYRTCAKHHPAVPDQISAQHIADYPRHTGSEER